MSLVWGTAHGGHRSASRGPGHSDRSGTAVGVVAALRAALHGARLISAVLNVFIRALFGELRRRADASFWLPSSQCGAVTFVQPGYALVVASGLKLRQTVDNEVGIDGTLRLRNRSTSAHRGSAGIVKRVRSI